MGYLSYEDYLNEGKKRILLIDKIIQLSKKEIAREELAFFETIELETKRQELDTAPECKKQSTIRARNRKRIYNYVKKKGFSLKF